MLDRLALFSFFRTQPLGLLVQTFHLLGHLLQPGLLFLHDPDQPFDGWIVSRLAIGAHRQPLRSRLVLRSVMRRLGAMRSVNVVRCSVMRPVRVMRAIAMMRRTALRMGGHGHRMRSAAGPMHRRVNGRMMRPLMVLALMRRVNHVRDWSCGTMVRAAPFQLHQMEMQGGRERSQTGRMQHRNHLSQDEHLQILLIVRTGRCGGRYESVELQVFHKHARRLRWQRMTRGCSGGSRRHPSRGLRSPSLSILARSILWQGRPIDVATRSPTVILTPNLERPIPRTGLSASVRWPLSK